MNENNNPANGEHEMSGPDGLRPFDAVPRDGPNAVEVVAEIDPGPEPRIWVASLSDYNDGRLHGRWIEVGKILEDVHQEVAEMLEESPMLTAEEYAIHDYDGFGPVHFGEYENLEMVHRIAEGIREHGEAFAQWVALLDRAEWEDQLDNFEEHYQGQWSSMEGFAEQLLDDLGVDLDSLGPANLAPYVKFDIEAFARDLAMDYRVNDTSGGVYVFYW